MSCSYEIIQRDLARLLAMPLRRGDRLRAVAQAARAAHDLVNETFVVEGYVYSMVSLSALRGDVRGLRECLAVGGNPDALCVRADDGASWTALRLALSQDDGAPPRAVVGRGVCAIMLMDAGADLFGAGGCGAAEYDGGPIDCSTNLKDRVRRHRLAVVLARPIACSLARPTDRLLARLQPKTPATREYYRRLAEQVAAACDAKGTCAGIDCGRYMSDRAAADRGGRCQGCYRAKYCSAACQQRDWPFHKRFCKSTDSHACHVFVHFK